MTRLQGITYRGRTVAVCGGRRFLLADELLQRPPGDPELTFVVMMCAYALDVAGGVLPGPYNETDARRYARAGLIPDELLERPKLDHSRAARALGLPVEELRAAHREHRGHAGPLTTDQSLAERRQRPLERSKNASVCRTPEHA